jgi:hypothetical protein
MPHFPNQGYSSGRSAWVQETNLFREWESIKKQISLHKWYESEKAGHDIGWDRATVDWMIRHGPRTRSL